MELDQLIRLREKVHWSVVEIEASWPVSVWFGAAANVWVVAS